MRQFLFLIIISACMVLTGCHSSKKIAGGDKAVVSTVKTDNLKGKQKKVVEESLTWLGTPYKYACSDKKRGTDCSGLVLRVYEDAAGLKLPRNSKKQAEFCRRIGKSKVKPGDLVFFATGRDKNNISHVGIMIDEMRFVHASTKKGVIVSDMNTPYYQRTFMMFGRVPRL